MQTQDDIPFYMKKFMETVTMQLDTIVAKSAANEKRLDIIVAKSAAMKSDWIP